VIRFLYPHWLWLLALLPLLALLRGRRGSRAAVQYSSLQTLRQDASERRSRRACRWLMTLNLAALALPIVGLAENIKILSPPTTGRPGDFSGAVGKFEVSSEATPTFSYFDPDARQYVGRLRTPITVAVASGSGPLSVTALTARSLAQTAAANPAPTDLAPNKVEPGSFVSSLRPVLFAPWFIALQGLPAMALVIVLVVHCRKQRHAHDLHHAAERAAEAAIREQLAAMDAALAANCAPAFFRAARHAVQELLAQRWKLPVSQVTVTEINRRLNGDGDDLRALFAFADGVVYSGRRVLPEDLKRWKDTVIQHLKKLEDL